MPLFNEALSTPIRPADRDALWATAALISLAAMCKDVGAHPEQAWPCKSTETSDLSWLNMSKGKMAVWDLTDPVRPGGLFHPMADTYAAVATPLPSKGIAGVPAALVELCNLDSMACVENTPYFAAVHAIAQVRAANGKTSLKTRALAFMGHMQPAFKVLLHAKDPVALALLASWYTKAWTAAWWIERRAVVECASICLFLRRWHATDCRIQRFLRWVALDGSRST